MLYHKIPFMALRTSSTNAEANLTLIDAITATISNSAIGKQHASRVTNCLNIFAWLLDPQPPHYLPTS